MRFVTRRQNRPRLALPKEYEHVQVDSRKKVPDLVLSLFEADCKRQDLAGGKGASLAVLTSISRQFRNVRFVLYSIEIRSGYCNTVTITQQFHVEAKVTV